MVTLGYILFGIALLPYIAVPILIWTTQRFSSSFHLRHLQETFLPKEILEEFRIFSGSLQETDFEHCFDVFTRDELLGLRFYHRTLMNPIQKTWAICTAICNEEGVLHKTYLELKTQFFDGSSFSTHNSDLIGAPIKSSKRKFLALPVDTPVTVLLQIHRFHIKRFYANCEAIVPKPHEAEKSFKHFLNQEHEEQLKLGAIYFDEQEKMFRPTWAGAILLGWYSMWPLTFVRRIYSSFKIRILMKSLASANL